MASATALAAKTVATPCQKNEYWGNVAENGVGNAAERECAYEDASGMNGTRTLNLHKKNESRSRTSNN